MARLQPFFCHKIDSELVNQVPVLAENDWIAKQKLTEYLNEFMDEKGGAKTWEAIKHLYTVEKGPPEIFLKHGIFPLIYYFNIQELKALFLVLCLEPQLYVKPQFFIRLMQIKRSYVSAILKKCTKWRFFVRYRDKDAQGRARGRQLLYGFNPDVRARLDKDLSDFDFFRDEVKKTIRPTALHVSEIPWRKDLGLFDRDP